MPPPSASSHRRLASADFRWLAPGLAGGATATLFLPWLRSGAVERNAFATARAARELGLLEGFGDAAAGFVSVIPVLLALSVLAAALNRSRLGSTLAAAVGAGVVAAAMLLLRSPVSSGVGPKAGVVLGGAAVIAGMASVTRGQR